MNALTSFPAYLVSATVGGGTDGLGLVAAGAIAVAGLLYSTYGNVKAQRAWRTLWPSNPEGAAAAAA